MYLPLPDLWLALFPGVFGQLPVTQNNSLYVYVKKCHKVQEYQKRYYLSLSLERRVIFTEKEKDFPFCIVRVNPALEMGTERLFLGRENCFFFKVL